MPKPFQNKQTLLPSIPESSSIRSIRYLTLQGGGMKGIGFVGVVKSLEETGVLAQLEEVAGTSAGALAATLIAIGCSAKEIRQEMLRLNFKHFQDPEVPGWVETLQLNNINPFNLSKWRSSTSHKVKAINQSLRENADAGVFEQSEIQASPSDNLPAEPLYHGVFDLVEKAGQVYSNLGLWQGDALSNWISSIVARKTGNPNITFAELAALTHQNLSPFKKLILTGSNLTDKKLEYYNATETPDMPIVDAVRISASFPGAFKPVVRSEQGVKKILVDGGLLENLPDVFHKAPYFNKDNLSPQAGNKESLAIVFQDPNEVKPSVINNGLDLAKALYASKMSDAAMYERYGDNIVHINPMGVETLEFGASDTKRHKLAISGANSVMHTFNKILQKEEQAFEDLSKLRFEALIKLKTAYQFELIQKKNDQRILNKIVLLNQAIESHRVNPDRVQQLKKQFEHRILQRQKKTHLSLQTDEALSNACQQSIELYKRTELELHSRLQYLKLARRALILRREEIAQEFERDQDKHSFKKSLIILNHLQRKILQNRQHYAEAEQDRAHSLLNIGSGGENALLQKLSTEYDKLIKMRDDFFKNIPHQSKVTQINSQIFQDFFKALHCHCIQNITFEIPTNLKKLRDYYETDITYCGQCIREGKIEKNQTKKEQQIIQKYETLFKGKTERSQHYTKLIHFKRELDESIARKTTFLGKINHYLIKNGPLLKQVMNPFLKLASFTAFMCSLPFAISFVPIAKAIQHFSKDEGIQSTAKRFINFFKYTNVDYDTKLRGFQKTTTHLLHIMKKNYTQDKSTFTYLQNIFAEHLKNSGFKLKDLFIKQDDETQENYEHRIKNVQKQFQAPTPKSIPIELTSAPEVNLNNPHSDEAAEARFQKLKAKLDRENTLLIHSEFMSNMKSKLHAKHPLSQKENPIENHKPHSESKAERDAISLFLTMKKKHLMQEGLPLSRNPVKHRHDKK